ncbi:MAG: NAD-dependent epimerase/dehydratase family protein [Pseudoclavibacter sp.]
MPSVSHSSSEPDLAIIGAGGFIGGRVRRLAEAQGRRVVGFTRREPAVVDGRLVSRFESLRTVVWAASMITPAVAETSPERVNDERDAFREVLEALPGSTRLIFLSSGGTVYSGPNTPYSESAPAIPTNRYGAAKLELETLARSAPGGAVVLRISNAYGPGQLAKRGQGVLGHWMQAMLGGQPITIFGDGSSARDYVYVDDVARAILAAADGTSPRVGIFNIGSGMPTTLDDLVVALGAVAGRPVSVEYRPDRGFDVSATWLDVREARRTLDWSPSVGLEDGLGRMWNWVQARHAG